MLHFTTPDDLMDALGALRSKSANSAPDLSSQAGKLAELLQSGQETRYNDKGLGELQKVVERLNIWVDRVKIRDIAQLSRVTSLKGLLSSLTKDLRREVADESTTLPLDFFADTSDDSPFDIFIRKFTVEVKALEEIACPELRPGTTMIFEFAGARIDTTTSNHSGDVGSFNYGEQKHSYAAATVRANGALASRNINDPTGKVPAAAGLMWR